MSGVPNLLVFLDPDGSRRHSLRVEGEDVTAVDAPAPADARVSLVVPGEQVSVHWLPLDPSLTTAQAAAAARLMLTDVCAQPLAEMHVAAGAEEDGLRCVAAVPNAVMAQWLETARADGVDPATIIPEPLLLPPPERGYLRCNGAPRPIYRGRATAFSVEDEIARLVVGDVPVVKVERSAFDRAVVPAVEKPMLNLRQGPFARRKAWKIDAIRARRLGMLVLGLVLLTIAIQIGTTIRYTLAADRADAEARRVAISVLGRDAASAPPERLAERLAALRGGGVGFGAAASALFGAVRATPNVELAAIAFDESGAMRTSARADSPDTVGVLVQRIEAAGYRVDTAPLRMEGGRQVAELVVRSR